MASKVFNLLVIFVFFCVVFVNAQKCPDPAPFCDKGNCYSINKIFFQSKL